MKISFPLSLKVTLWLLLNLLVLGVVAFALLVTEVGGGWDAIVRGPAGKRPQQLAEVIAGEFTAAGAPDKARAVLERFRRTYGAQFFVLHPNLPGASHPDALPGPVAMRAEEGPAARRGPTEGRAPGGPGEGPEMGPARPGFGGPPRMDGPPPGPGGGEGFQDGPPADPERRAAAEVRGRFLVRTGEPRGFWLGFRVPIERPVPVTLVMHTDSWWGLMRLLDLQPWLLAGGGIVAFSILFWLPLVLGITRDLRRLTLATQQIAEGKFETRVASVKRRDELGHLGESINTMAGRLDTLVNGQKRFLGDVAHELGSPLARLQLAIEILEARSGAGLREPLADVRDEVHQMTALVNELLAFTKAGLRPRAAELAAVELAPLVHETLAREDSAGRIVTQVPADLAARADAPLLARALGNLARNALRYAGESGQITLVAQREGDRVVVAVADEGPGVPAEALARLGEPFYRPEVARTRETGGVGLGLAIVRSAAAACGGEVRFENRAPRGFRAELRLAAA